MIWYSGAAQQAPSASQVTVSNRKKRSKIGALYAGLRTHEEETPTETSPDELATKQVESYKVMAKKSGLESLAAALSGCLVRQVIL